MPAETNAETIRTLPGGPPGPSESVPANLTSLTGAALERLAVLAVQAERWPLASAVVTELRRRGIGSEAVERVALAAAEAGVWEVAEAALGTGA